MQLIQDHAQIAWGNWTAQFGNSPKLEALVKALHKPANGLQGALRQLYDERWLDAAVGRQLDGIGEIVGLSRSINEIERAAFFGPSGRPGVEGISSLEDDEYRRLLYWKIAVNNGHGTAPEISASLKAIFDLGDALIEDIGNAKIRIHLRADPTVNSALLVHPRRWVPTLAGVGVAIVTSGYVHVDSRIRLIAFRDRGRIAFDGCNRTAVHRWRTLDGCWAISGGYEDRLLDGSWGLDDLIRLDGEAPTGTPLDSTFAYARSVGRTVAPVQAAGGDRFKDPGVLSPLAKMDGSLRVDGLKTSGHWLTDGSKFIDYPTLSTWGLRRLDGTWSLGREPGRAGVWFSAVVTIRRDGDITREVI